MTKESMQQQIERYFPRYRRYPTLFPEVTPRYIPMRTFSPTNLWQDVPDGIYLYVVIPPSPGQDLELRLSGNTILPDDVKHQDLSAVIDEEKRRIPADVPAAGIVRVAFNTVGEVDIDTGHFQVGRGNIKLEDEALEAAWLAFDLCGAPLTDQTKFTRFTSRTITNP